MIQSLQNGQRVLRLLATLTAAVIAVSCGRDQLLDVQTPDQIPTDVAQTPAGAAALRVAAVGNFATFYGGDVAGTGVGINVASGLLSDEMESARGGTEHLDTRAIIDANFPVTSPWSFAGQATTQLIRAIKAVQQYYPETSASEIATKKTQLAQLHLYLGYSYILLAEAYCNGIPISNADDASPKSTTYSNAQLFALAITELNAAISAAGTSTDDAAIKNAANVGIARATIDAATPANMATEFAKAATQVAGVPSAFVYNVSYSQSTIVNAVYDWMNATLNFAPADKEGGNGLAFISANDPRVTVRRNADGTVRTQAGQDGLQHAVETVYSTGNQPIVLASGVEARLIEAEAALAAGDNATYLAKVNAARATRTDLTGLADPGSATARVDQLMSERAFWFWGTSHRLGDLRRLVRQYGRAANSVYPTGPYFKGGAYGSDVVLVPSQAEKNNTDWAGCTDKNA
jgi:hypothetical protein